MLLLTVFILIGCEKKKGEKVEKADLEREKNRKAVPLPRENFIDVAKVYKESLDHGLRGYIVRLTERHSRKILVYTVNLEHMIYFASVNSIRTNRLIVMLKNRNPNIIFLPSEIQWVNNRWDFESKALLDDEWKRPKIPRTKELINIKTTHKKITDFEYYVHFDSALLDIKKYKIDPTYIPFYWEYKKEENKIFIPEVRLYVVQKVGAAKIDLTRSHIKRGKKWIGVINHPLFLWKGSIPKWAEQTMKSESYFYKKKMGNN